MTSNDLINQLASDTRVHLEQVRERFADWEHRHTGQQPEPGQWTVQDCFAHLNSIYGWYLPLIELAIHKARARRWTADTPVRYQGRGGRLVRRNRPEKQRKIASPRRFDPTRQTNKGSEIKSFLIHTERFARLLESARGIDLNRPRIRKAGAWFASYRLANLLEWLVLHNQRHIAQAENRMKAKEDNR